MAKAVAICKCKTCGGDFEKTAVKRNRKEADSWEIWAVDYYDECDECEERRIKAEREAANAEAAELSKEAELPELTGTLKQVAWAGKIRWDFYERTQKEFDYFKEMLSTTHTERGVQKWQEIYDENSAFAKWLFRKSDASFWIDKRNLFVIEGRGIRDVRVYLKDAYDADQVPEEMTDEIMAPVIIEPENKTSAVVCEISATEKEVTVRSAKDQGVIDLVKGLGYRWNGSTWSKAISVITGAAEDRLIEIGNRLLLAGYPVKVDPKYHDQIISGKYEPESGRWITRLEDGNLRIYTGKDPELEKEARKISGATKYGKIVVPPSAMDEIMDFSKIHDFRISPGAREAMKKYKASVITVHPVKGAEIEYHEENVGDVLNSSRDVLEDLKEEE